MIYYITWTNCDPEFQEYDEDCNVLLSPSLLPSNWSTSQWNSLPQRLFVDSGIYTAGTKNIIDGAGILNDQIRICKNWPDDKPLYFSHPDIIIPYNATFKESQKLININLERAKIYYGSVSKLNKKIEPVGVIHGLCEEDILSSFFELKSIGYKYFAIGSLSIRLVKNRELVLQLLQIINDYDLCPLHIFGITIPLIENSHKLKFTSYDTSSPIKLAYYGTVLYGTPLKRYVISPSMKQIQRDKNFAFRVPIEKPMDCECPICINNPKALIEGSSIKLKFNRIIHNYFQLKWSPIKT